MSVSAQARVLVPTAGEELITCYCDAHVRSVIKKKLLWYIFALRLRLGYFPDDRQAKISSNCT